MSWVGALSPRHLTGQNRDKKMRKTGFFKSHVAEHKEIMEQLLAVPNPVSATTKKKAGQLTCFFLVVAETSFFTALRAEGGTPSRFTALFGSQPSGRPAVAGSPASRQKNTDVLVI